MLNKKIASQLETAWLQGSVTQSAFILSKQYNRNSEHIYSFLENPSGNSLFLRDIPKLAILDRNSLVMKLIYQPGKFENPAQIQRDCISTILIDEAATTPQMKSLATYLIDQLLTPVLQGSASIKLSINPIRREKNSLNELAHIWRPVAPLMADLVNQISDHPHFDLHAKIEIRPTQTWETAQRGATYTEAAAAEGAHQNLDPLDSFVTTILRFRETIAIETLLKLMVNNQLPIHMLTDPNNEELLRPVQAQVERLTSHFDKTAALIGELISNNESELKTDAPEILSWMDNGLPRKALPPAVMFISDTLKRHTFNHQILISSLFETQFLCRDIDETIHNLLNKLRPTESNSPTPQKRRRSSIVAMVFGNPNPKLDELVSTEQQSPTPPKQRRGSIIDMFWKRNPNPNYQKKQTDLLL